MLSPCAKMTAKVFGLLAVALLVSEGGCWRGPGSYWGPDCGRPYYGGSRGGYGGGPMGKYYWPRGPAVMRPGGGERGPPPYGPYGPPHPPPPMSYGWPNSSGGPPPPLGHPPSRFGRPPFPLWPYDPQQFPHLKQDPQRGRPDVDGKGGESGTGEADLEGETRERHQRETPTLKQSPKENRWPTEVRETAPPSASPVTSLEKLKNVLRNHEEVMAESQAQKQRDEEFKLEQKHLWENRLRNVGKQGPPLPYTVAPHVQASERQQKPAGPSFPGRKLVGERTGMEQRGEELTLRQQSLWMKRMRNEEPQTLEGRIKAREQGLDTLEKNIGPLSQSISGRQQFTRLNSGEQKLMGEQMGIKEDNNRKEPVPIGGFPGSRQSFVQPFLQRSEWQNLREWNNMRDFNSQVRRYVSSEKVRENNEEQRVNRQQMGAIHKGQPFWERLKNRMQGCFPEQMKYLEKRNGGPHQLNESKAFLQLAGNRQFLERSRLNAEQRFLEGQNPHFRQKLLVVRPQTFERQLGGGQPFESQPPRQPYEINSTKLEQFQSESKTLGRNQFPEGSVSQQQAIDKMNKENNLKRDTNFTVHSTPIENRPERSKTNGKRQTSFRTYNIPACHW